MMNIIASMASATGKFIGFALVVNLFVFVIRGGKEAIRDIQDTLRMALKVVTQRLQSWLYQKYKEPKKENETPKKEEKET